MIKGGHPTDPEQETLRGLGPKSRSALEKIGIESRAQLIEKGAIATYLMLKNQLTDFAPSLNFLYALVGAIEDRDWREVAKNDKLRLLTELQAAIEFESELNNPDT